jgi:hypothetical protein
MRMRPRKRARYVFCKLMLGSLRRPHPVYRVEVQAVPSSCFASALAGLPYERPPSGSEYAAFIIFGQRCH